MKNYKMIVQYDGSRYKGWQVQKATDMTIQGKLQAVLSTLCNHPVEVIGSGRTDAGVHAIGQVANFYMDDEISIDAIFEHLCQYLPDDIGVKELVEVPERFHSRYHAIQKTYVYRIHTAKTPNVFERKYVYHYAETLDVSAMKEAASYLMGTHDFMAFCGNKRMKKSTVRTIHEIEIIQEPEEIRLAYTGDGFLQNMIRIITGTLIEVGTHRKNPKDVKEILDGRNRELAGYTAPPQGLVLKKVVYGTMDCDK